jgi:ABC-type multidrug transport system fused ATPase/permease subunit
MTSEAGVQSIPTMLRRLWKHVTPRRRAQFGFLLLMMIAASLAEVVSIGAVFPFLGALTSPETVFQHPRLQPLVRLLGLSAPGELLLPLTVAFGSAALIAGTMRVLLLWVQTRLSHAVGADFSVSIYRRTLYQPYSTHLGRNTSELISGITGKANGLVNQIIFPVLTIITSALMCVMVLALLLFIEPTTTVGTLLGFTFILVTVMVLTRARLARNSNLISRESTAIIKSLQEGLGGIRDVLIDGSQNTFTAIYTRADLRWRRAVANLVIIGASPRPIIEALGMALIAAIAYFLANGSKGLGAAIPILGALAIGMQRLLPVMQNAFASWAQVQGSKASLGDALDFLDQPLPPHASALETVQMPFAHEIRMSGVGFRYVSDGQWVLRNLSFAVGKGERVGFIGSTGAGKSTVLDIVMGLLPPTEGTLTIDGTEVTLASHRSWQAHIAHVPQSIFLSDTSIAENIAFGVPPDRIDHARVHDAARKAHIAEAIATWDKGYDTVVGERGIRLSGGQRQRIGVARALYKKADVIVFDEATSALDNETEQAVMESIETLSSGLTILIVAHRLTTLRGCDRIIELEGGAVARVGTYEEIVVHPLSRSVASRSGRTEKNAEADQT